MRTKEEIMDDLRSSGRLGAISALEELQAEEMKERQQLAAKVEDLSVQLKEATDALSEKVEQVADLTAEATKLMAERDALSKQVDSLRALVPPPPPTPPLVKVG